jgi:ABC-type antimicrobial peptide transport system permease subunit
MSFFLRKTLKGIAINKRKFSHNVLGIAIGILLLVLITSLSSSFKDVLYEQMKIADDKVVTVALGNKSNTLSYIYLPVFDENAIKTVKEMDSITKTAGLKSVSVTSIYYTKNENTKRVIASNIYSSDQSFLDLYNASIQDGAFCSKEDEVVIGSSVSKTYNINVGDSIDVDCLGKEQKLTVSGVLSEVSSMGFSSTPNMINNIILLNNQNSIFKSELYVSIVAEVSNVSDLEKTSSAITELLNASENMSTELSSVDMDAIVVNNQAILEMIDGYFEYVNIFIILLFVVVSIIVVINFSNLMTITILSRSKEIAIMKVCGGSNSQIAMFYTMDCLFMGIVGSISGLLIGIIIDIIVVLSLNWNLKISILYCIFAFCVGVLSPTIAGLFTQRKIKKQSISDVLKI